MTKPKNDMTPAPTSEPHDKDSKFSGFGGSKQDAFNMPLLDSVLNATWVFGDKERANRLSTERVAAMVALAAIAPKNEIEGMLAAQMIATHNATMECFRRAMIGEQTFEGRHENLNQANKLSRSYVVLLEALNRHRGKGQQKVTVEHVHVHSGGQAVVGVVGTPERHGLGGGDVNKTEELPHARQITDAPESPLQSPCTTDRQSLQQRRHAERTLPATRRQKSRGTPW